MHIATENPEEEKCAKRKASRAASDEDRGGDGRGPLETIGRFTFSPGSVHPRQKQRLREICGFFDDDIVTRLLLPVAMQEYAISLRLLDYTMTNWAKKTRIMVEMNTSRGKIPWNLFSLYKDWLRFYRRRGFDPFRRRERIFFSHTFPDGTQETLDTTVAQLNFLRWAEMYGILDYVSAHKEEIEEDMMKTLGESKRRRVEAQRRPREVAQTGAKKRKRAELSRAPAAKCVVYPIRQEIRFEAVETDE